MMVLRFENMWRFLLLIIPSLFNIYMQPEVYCIITSFIYIMMYELMNCMNGKTVEREIKKWLYGILLLLSYKRCMNIRIMDAIGSTVFIIMCCHYLPILIIPIF